MHRKGTQEQDESNRPHPPDVSLSRRRTLLSTATACSASSRLGRPPLRTLPGKLVQACGEKL
jgi:hypothetical protein